MVLAGRRFYPVDMDAPLLSFAFALAIATISLMSMGFLIASIVPSARFAQPLGSLILYPMVAISGLFAPLDSLPPMGQTVAQSLPLTYAVSLLRGIWIGEAWSAHTTDVAALAGFLRAVQRDRVARVPLGVDGRFAPRRRGGRGRVRS